MQHQSESSRQVRMAVVGDFGLAWAQRVVWAVCIGVYLTVFIGGIQAGGGDTRFRSCAGNLPARSVSDG